MQDPFLGQITYYPYSFAPKNWATCQGQILPISQFTALFALLGTQFGGNGITNFALPDLQGRVPVGQGPLAGSGTVYFVGEMAGEESVRLIGGEMPAHSHHLNATTTQGTTNDPPGALLASPFTGPRGNESTGQPYNIPATTPTFIELAFSTIGPSGLGLPHDNTQPSLVLTPCIALSGVFPQRS